MTGCDCWANTFALGHDGHCCFLRDDRNRRVNGGWRPDTEICHIPGSNPGSRTTTRMQGSRGSGLTP